MKKAVKSLLLVLLSLAILTGCSKKDEGPKASDEKFDLTVWVHPYVGAEKKADIEKVYADMTAKFKETNPNANVVFEEIPWANREQKITTTLAAGQGPDIFYLIPDQLTQFADQGLIADIKEVNPSLDLKDFTDTSISAVTYKDKLYGLPMLRESQTLFYNKAILKDLGVEGDKLPTTWAEFDELAKKAVEKGYYARSFDGGNTLNASLYPLIWQAGGDVVNDKNEISINNDKSLKAWELVDKWYKEGYIAKESITEENTATLWLEGKMLAVWGANNTIPLARENNIEFLVGSPLKEEVEATFGVTGAFVVSNGSKQKAKAAEFLSVMTDADNMRAFNKVTGYIPARTSAQDLFADDAEMKQMAELTKIARPGVINSQARVFMPDVQADLQAMLEGKLTPKEAADKAAESIKSYVEK